MSCDPTWEVCDAVKAEATTTADNTAVLADEDVIYGEDIYEQVARLWGLAAASQFWTAYTYYTRNISS